MCCPHAAVTQLLSHPLELNPEQCGILLQAAASAEAGHVVFWLAHSDVYGGLACSLQHA